MHAFKLKHTVPDLQPIGSVSLLGATPTAGDPQVAGAMIYGEPQDAFTCGLFSSTEGSFTMTYPFTEHATVLEGEVELTVAGGEPQRFAPGDSWFVNKLIMPGGALRLLRATKSRSAVAPVSGSATGGLRPNKRQAARTVGRIRRSRHPAETGATWQDGWPRFSGSYCLSTLTFMDCVTESCATLHLPDDIR